MKNVIYLIIGFIIIIFSGSFFNFMEIPFFHARPDFLFLYITFLALFVGSERGAMIGLILGFITDIFVGKYFGFNGLILYGAGAIFGIFKDKIFKEKFGGAVLLLLLGVLLKNILTLLLYRTNAYSWTNVSLKLVSVMFFNFLVGILLYYPMKALICKIEK